MTRRIPPWAKYLPGIESIKPGASAEELRHRANLMLYRDRAEKAAQICSWEAAPIFTAVVTIAAQHALTDMPAEQLAKFRYAVLHAYLSACQMDLVFPGGDGDGLG